MLIQLLATDPSAALTIAQRTPTWVWGLMMGLLFLGALQLRERQLSLRRAIAPAAGLALLSLFTLRHDLAPTPWLVHALLVWFAAAALALHLGSSGTARVDIRYDRVSQRFTLPGSALPLLIMMAIFWLKYLVNVELALQPQLRFEPEFALSMAAGYGVLNGLLGRRSLALWRLTRHSGTPLPA